MLRFGPPVFEHPDRDSFTMSLWHHTAIAGAPYPQLNGSHTADVIVIGAGYTGLAAAIDLAESGQKVAVLEAREPGFGASGRNGGQVIPAFKYDPDRIADAYGDDAAETVLDLVSRTADVVFDLVQRYGIKCDPTYGWVQAAHSKQSCDVLVSRYRQWAARGAPVDYLDADKIRDLTGTNLYVGGIRFRNAGTVQPLSYARGLAQAATAAGANIFCHSKVNQITQVPGGWSIRTEKGAVVAPAVIIATNAYTLPIWPGLRESVVPLYSVQIATDPLPEPLQSTVMPAVPAMADMRRLVCYCRTDRDHRFVIGMRGPYRNRPRERDIKALRAAAYTMHPSLKNIDFPYRWSGRVAMSADQVPHIHQLASGVYAALGYSGRGVGMATMMGKILATACTTQDTSSSPYPFTPLRPIPLYTFHRMGVQAVVAYYRLMDGRV